MALTFIKTIEQGGFGIIDIVKDEEEKKYTRKTFQINQDPSFPKNLEGSVEAFYT